MFRLSRIHAPRGTLAAFALVVVAMLLFGVIAQAHGPGVAPSACMAGLDAPLVKVSER
ncbi:MAG: hypothetical protein OXP28_04370 [Gammaproteobacteria bacterium]|nr:hypothetical protein [Gammaproteobacteria bacterium]MDE0224353.1 hypothetical protein [Gammaproteobacteria bacterium]